VHCQNCLPRGNFRQGQVKALEQVERLLAKRLSPEAGGVKQFSPPSFRGNRCGVRLNVAQATEPVRHGAVGWLKDNEFHLRHALC
jgi:hypothetical protein